MNRQIGIVGLGVTGMSLVRYYRELGFKVRVFDQLHHPPKLATLKDEFPDVECNKLDSFTELSEQVSDCELIVPSPGVPLHRLPANLPLISELDLFRMEWHKHARNNPQTKLITVTGTNGKSTACELIAGLIRVNGWKVSAIGNLGLPMLDAVRDWNKQEWPDCVVVELSSYQLSGVVEMPAAQVSVLLNIGTDHLDWHADQKEYASTKKRIFDNAEIAVYDSDDASVAKAAEVARRQISFSSNSSCQGEGWGVSEGYLVHSHLGSSSSSKSLIARGIIPTTAAAALTCVMTAYPDQDTDILLSAIENIGGLPHRLEVVRVVGGITYINDSKATNSAASCAALGAIGRRCVPIFGGVDKTQDFTGLARMAREIQAPKIVLLGMNTYAWQKALDQEGLDWQSTQSMAESVRMAKEIAIAAGIDCVILSPGGASQDQYKNFIDRGEDFCTVVNDLT